jgi:hypothetical protein
MECGWLRRERLGWQVRKELEAEGSPIMDDRENDGRGARMASGDKGDSHQIWATYCRVPA